MIEVFKNIDNRLEKSSIGDENIWVNLNNPDEDEIVAVSKKLNISEDFLKAALDREELSRVEIEDENVLILINASYREDVPEVLEYNTIPVAIILTPNAVVTVALRDFNFFKKMKTNILTIDPKKKTRVTMQVIYQVAIEYLRDLVLIDKYTDEIEKKLSDNLHNDYLIKLLSLEKTLVYFSTSLNGVENVVRKINRTGIIKKYEEDEDLIEDTLIELEQAKAMADINSKVIRSIRDAFASIISNNLNTTMKILASFTIILTIPTMVFSYFGMNSTFSNFISTSHFANLLIILFTLIMTFIVFKIMKNKDMF